MTQITANLMEKTLQLTVPRQQSLELFPLRSPSRYTSSEKQYEASLSMLAL